jgi:hypothetical protein
MVAFIFVRKYLRSNPYLRATQSFGELERDNAKGFERIKFCLTVVVPLRTRETLAKGVMLLCNSMKLFGRRRSLPMSA